MTATSNQVCCSSDECAQVCHFCRLWKLGTISIACFVFPDVFLTQFSALQTSRSVRTRRLAAAEENTEVTRTARLAHIFKEICDMIMSYKGKHRPCTLDIKY